MRYSLGFYFVAIITAAPLLLWLDFRTFSGLKDFSSAVVIFGQATGLVGASLFFTNFILSARFQLLEKIFVGLNRVYYYHHQLGAISLVLLLSHPILLSLQYLSASIVYVAQFFIPSLGAMENIVGSAALFSLVFLLYLTLFARLKYQTWRLSHKYMGIPLILAGLHLIIVPGNLAQNFPLKIYMLSLFTAALLSWLYRTVFFQQLVKRYRYKVAGTKLLANSVTEVMLTPVGKKMDYLPGQFLFIEVHSLGIETEQHPFSIITNPGQNELGFAAKSLGDYTETLKLLKLDAEVKVEGPFGVFSYLNTANTQQLWIAGGIGITPFVGMARSLETGSPYQIHLVYSVKDLKEAVYLEEFEELSRRNPQFIFHLYDSEKEGRLDAGKLAAMVPEIFLKDVFICGPLPMMTALRTQLVKQGIKNRKIYTEEFALYQSK